MNYANAQLFILDIRNLALNVADLLFVKKQVIVEGVIQDRCESLRMQER